MVLSVIFNISHSRGSDSDAGRDWGQEEKGTTEDEMAGWHHWLDGCESEWTPGVGEWQGGLVCCDSWGRKESDTTERLNWAELRGSEVVSQCSFICISLITWSWVSFHRLISCSYSLLFLCICSIFLPKLETLGCIKSP